MTKAVHYIGSSVRGESITFASTEDYENFQADYRALLQKYHKQNEAKYGYWAANQDKFVKTLSELNDLDRYSY